MMTSEMHYPITFEANPSQDDIQRIYDGISAHAKHKKGFSPFDFFAYFIRDRYNNILGGCNGNTLYGCLYFDSLWITDSLRGQGYGTKLIRAAEQYGLEHACTFAAVDTMDWEALGFYKKLGFEVECERHGFIQDSICYFLRKSLVIDAKTPDSKVLTPNIISAANIFEATPDEAEFIDTQIVEYNKAQVPFTQELTPIFKNYVIKEDGSVIAGINALIYHWGILYIDVLFVNEQHRGKNLGSTLLQQVENDAKAMGATLSHLDTFDFQANDFYLKKGYQVFGVLENCPTGHKRYYLRKSLLP